MDIKAPFFGVNRPKKMTSGKAMKLSAGISHAQPIANRPLSLRRSQTGGIS
jgi:hypothetical protein